MGDFCGKKKNKKIELEEKENLKSPHFLGSELRPGKKNLDRGKMKPRETQNLRKPSGALLWDWGLGGGPSQR